MNCAAGSAARKQRPKKTPHPCHTLTISLADKAEAGNERGQVATEGADNSSSSSSRRRAAASMLTDEVALAADKDDDDDDNGGRDRGGGQGFACVRLW